MIARLAIVTLAVTAWLLPGPAAAQTYSSWDNPDAESDGPTAKSESEVRLQSFVERLRAIVDQAEKDRAADPVLLRDLRALADGYDRPWTSVVLSDAFADGEYETDPVWRVIEGRYWIEKDWGLRNALEEVETSSDNAGKQVAAQIFGQVLTQALGGSSSSSTAAQSRVQPTAIFSKAAITNAFSASVSFSSWVDNGRLIMGPWQSKRSRAGYRVVYDVGGSIHLIAVSANGTRTVASAAGPFNLEDKAVHDIVWDRHGDGTMRVSLDGETVLETADTGFSDAFKMWGFATVGGDFIVKSVEVRSTPQP